MTDYGYMRVSAAVPVVRIADTDFNLRQIKDIVKDAVDKEADVIVTPELSVTAYTCGDLFEQPLLLEKSEEAVHELAVFSKNLPIFIVVGVPVMAFGRRYNCAVGIAEGSIWGIVPKSHMPNYGEFYEKRWFESGSDIKGAVIRYAGEEVPFGTDVIFNYKGAKIGIEICEDLWMPVPPSSHQALAGADIILNLSASDELIGKHQYLLSLIAQQSGRCRCAYVYSSAGWGESSTDLVFSGNAIIAEDGTIKCEGPRFRTQPTLEIYDIDVEKLRSDRAKFSTFFDNAIIPSGFRMIGKNETHWRDTKTSLVDLKVDPEPFVPYDIDKRNSHCEEIFNIQSQGLMQRLNVIHCSKAVIGISGGLDSTLALLVTVRAFDRLNLDRKGIIGITMPGMATTSRTHSNAVSLMEELGVTALEIPIGKAVAQHFSDIDQDPDRYDVTYENSQARERTQILMDYANKVNAIVIGTGDMSELALGWCTYNGDHMSMYAVNSSVPKTLVRHLVKWFAREIGGEAEKTLLDIVDTPISPELVPSGKDEIGQKTEDLVGPYELHDFFLYHTLRNSFAPKKIYKLAQIAFEGKYDNATLLKWLRNFYRRFFNQQFKRSCMPDGPKVGSVSLSPRGDWRMPSDASSALWLKEVDALQ
ncbi:MAG: NAD(+) synthase [Bacteroides sp.]|nr:NAD(+) synthase [Bacteroides sp.]